MRGGCIEVVSSCEKIASGCFEFTARLHWRLHWSCIVIEEILLNILLNILLAPEGDFTPGGGTEQEHINRQGPEGVGSG